MNRVALALAVRLVQALTIRTAFAPDEFWQSLEVAHRIVFGYGHLTWEWAAGLRSYAHPLLFAIPYAALKALRLDSAWALARVPLLLQAVAAAGTDLYVAGLARLVLGRQAAGWCLLCQLASWFNAYCLIRTYSNSLEALYAAAGTYHWLHSRAAGGAAEAHNSDTTGGSSGSSGGGRGKQAGSSSSLGAAARRQQRAWVACAALSVVFRPASGLFWVLPAGMELWRQRGRGRWQLLLDAASVGGGLLGSAAVLDRMGYGRWVCVPWQFLRFNLLAGASAQYGSHPWHWNLSQGLPTVAASLLPLMAAGLLLAGGGTARQPALLAAWSLAAYSLPAHKEFRFLLPALQLLMPYCGLAAACLFGDAAGRGKGGAAAPGPPRSWRLAAAACLVLQLPMAAYFGLVHQGAQVGIMRLIRREAARSGSAGTSALFLTPCHATPYFSHVHHPGVRLRFLDCSPAQHATATALLNERGDAWLRLPGPCGAGMSQRQCFEREPEAYLGTVLEANQGQQPQLLVGFGPLMRRLEVLLHRWGYSLHTSLVNCWVQTDDDSPCELQLWSL